MVRQRRKTYEAGLRSCSRLPRPVISIGNLTHGGTGKTPAALHLARALAHWGHVAVLSRGYGRSPSSGQYLTLPRARRLDDDAHRIFGDEPVMIAHRGLENVSIHVGADRHRCGMAAMQRQPVDVFLLDDGFQHLGLHRDLEIVLLDGTLDPRGLELIPAGALREPIEVLTQADVVWITRCEPDGSHAIDLDWLALAAPRALVASSRYQPTAAVNVLNERDNDLARLRGMRVFAFCGIGSPDGFFRTVEECGATIVGREAFADHHRYKAGELRRLLRRARECGAEALATTEKDGVRLALDDAPELPIYEVRVAVHMLSGERELLDLARRTAGL